MWKTFTDCFNCLPFAAIVDEKIFCVSGGEYDATFNTPFPLIQYKTEKHVKLGSV